MSTVSVRCEALSKRIDALRQREAMQGQAEKLEQRRFELEQTRGRLAISIARTSVLVDQGHLDISVWPDVAETRAAQSHVREKLVEDLARLASGRDYKIMLAGAGQATSALEDAVSAAWAAVQSDADPVDERLLQRLDQFPNQARAATHIRELRAELDQLGMHPPVTAGEYASFAKVRDTLAEAWRNIDHGNLPESVARFFKTAQSPGGAPVSMWTQDVSAWLAQNGLLPSVRIHFRGGR